MLPMFLVSFTAVHVVEIQFVVKANLKSKKLLLHFLLIFQIALHKIFCNAQSANICCASVMAKLIRVDYLPLQTPKPYNNVHV